MRIIMDMDEVLVDFLNPLLAKHNERYNEKVTIDDLTEWELPSKMKSIFCEPGFFLELPPAFGGIEGMQYLKREGHDVIIATSPSESQFIARDKLLWIKILLPDFLDNLFITHRKQIIPGDIIVDDCPKYLKESIATHKIVMHRPYNQGIEGIRVRNWQELLWAVDEIGESSDADDIRCLESTAT